MDFFTQRDYASAALEHRTQALHMSFSAYLDRANFEVKYLSEQVSDGESLDALFQLHDVLFFGGLDFFYIEKEDGLVMEDPRVRLYTQDAFTSLVQSAPTDAWQHITSSDQSELLIYKKPLENNSAGQNQGFFYGFISLNNNLALASDLITSAGADYLRINDVLGKSLLVEKLSSYSEEVDYIRHEATLLLPSLGEKFSVEVRYARPLLESFSRWVLIGCLMVIVLMALLFGLVMVSAQRIMFRPIAGLPALGRLETLNFQEFEPLMAQMNHFQELLKVRDQHLGLLLNSLQSAIVFCDESARVTSLNEEAKMVFPYFDRAKTVFDMTPIGCHQSIQRALKGEYGGGFELELSEQNKVYEFQTHTFINEYGFRSVMLVGKDASEVRRLRWNLANRFPKHALDRPQPPHSLLRDELMCQSAWLVQQPQSATMWLVVIGELLDGIAASSKSENHLMSLGQMVCEQQDALEQHLQPNAKQCQFKIELALEDAAKQFHWTPDHRALITIALMHCYYSAISGRYIDIGWDRNGLVIKVYGAEEVSPALDWLRNEYPKLVKGRFEQAPSGRIQLSAALVADDEGESFSLSEKRVAYINNDYADNRRVIDALLAANVNLDAFSSFSEFFGTSMSYRHRYDAMMVAVGDDVLAAENVKKLLASSGQAALPIVYVCANRGGCAERQPTLFPHQLMPYRLAKQLTQLEHLEPISLGDWATHDTNFIITGGTDISQVIWQSELSANDFIARRESDVANLVSVLRHTNPVVILVLDQEAAQKALKLHLVKLVNTKWFVLEDFPERPDTMPFIDIGGQLPNEAAIDALLQTLKQKG
ncbi:LuxQ periplasmic sensor domain-containing protein [Marinomonas aquimarina]|nr:LuxQ periplasmic sensor domain-containing protein [Marinomonas aquimarina]